MSDQVWLAICSMVTTTVVTISGVVIAYLKLREPIREARDNTNGLLMHASARGDLATETLASAAAQVIAASAPEGSHIEPDA